MAAGERDRWSRGYSWPGGRGRTSLSETDGEADEAGLRNRIAGDAVARNPPVAGPVPLARRGPRGRRARSLPRGRGRAPARYRSRPATPGTTDHRGDVAEAVDP